MAKRHKGKKLTVKGAHLGMAHKEHKGKKGPEAWSQALNGNLSASGLAATSSTGSPLTAGWGRLACHQARNAWPVDPGARNSVPRRSARNQDDARWAENGAVFGGGGVNPSTSSGTTPVILTWRISTAKNSGSEAARSPVMELWAGLLRNREPRRTPNTTKAKPTKENRDD